VGRWRRPERENDSAAFASSYRNTYEHSTLWAAVEVVREEELQSPVIGFAHVALLHRAVDIIDVLPEWGAQGLLDGHSERMAADAKASPS
jgi:hypothetical protein